MRTQAWTRAQALDDPAVAKGRAAAYAWPDDNEEHVMAILFTADLHLGHANVIKHTQRPFADADDICAPDTTKITAEFRSRYSSKFFAGTERILMRA